MTLLTQQNIIIFSSIDWSTHWQLHHELTTSLTNSGNKVLFIENTGARSPKSGDFGRIINRIRFRIKSFHGFHQVSDKFFLYTPIFIPYPYSKFAIFINTFFIFSAIKRWTKVTNFINPIVVSFLPTPTIQLIIRKINPTLTIYYCADDMARFAQNPNKLRESENEFLRSSDLIFTTSHKMYERASKFSDSVFNFPAGVAFEKFNSSLKAPSVPEDMQAIEGKIIGYVGAITEVLNLNIIVELATTLSHTTIVLIGPKYINVSSLQNFKNIVLIDERPHNLIPDYINCFDVALIPYVVNEFTDSVYSCKLNEYLSMGKPVVSTNLQEIRIFNEENPNMILIGENIKHFVSNVELALVDYKIQSQAMHDERIVIAKKNAWSYRFTEIVTVINKALSIKPPSLNSWKDKMAKYYRQLHHYLIVRFLFVTVFYVLIFHSPLFWLAGEGLIIRDEIRSADAIVVFSGDGEINYKNTSYQRRALDAIDMYKSGYASKIFLSSGRKQTISDVEIIKLFLTDKGVPLTNIKILKKYPNSTYQNVKMVKEMLNENGIRSIIFLTSPYHSRRSALLWKKQAPNLQITIPMVIDTPEKTLSWGIGFDKMRIVLYEYLSIMYNFLLGRL